MTTNHTTVELAVRDGLERSCAQLYQYKPSATITFKDGETITVETEYAHEANDGPALLARHEGRVLGINMRNVATLSAELCPSETLLANLIACGITSAELAASVAA